MRGIQWSLAIAPTILFGACAAGGHGASTTTGAEVPPPERSVAPPEPDGDVLAREREFYRSLNIQPIITELHARSDDPELTALLERVHVQVGSYHEQDADAYGSTDAQGRPWIDVEIGYIGDVMRHSAMAAYLAMRWHEGRDRAKAFVTRLRSRAQGGETLDATDLGFPAGQFLPSHHLRFHAYLQSVTGADVVAWTIMHEIAHRLPSAEASEGSTLEGEVAADRWAFEKLRSLGYTLAYVALYFEARALYEPLEVALGHAAPPGRSTHPSFVERRARLMNDHPQWWAAPETPVRTMAFVLPYANEQGQLKSRLCWLTLDVRQEPDDPFTAAVTTDGKVGEMPGIRRADGFHLYDRKDRTIVELIVPPELGMSSVALRVVVRQDGRVVRRLTAVALQANTLATVGVSFRGWDLRQFVTGRPGLRPMVADVAQQAGASEALAAQVQAVVDEIWEAFEAETLGYASGRIDIEDFERLMERHMKRIMANPELDLDEAILERMSATLDAINPATTDPPGRDAEGRFQPSMRWILRNFSARRPSPATDGDR